MLNKTKIVILSIILLMTSSCKIIDNWYFCGLENTENMVVNFNERRIYSRDVFFPITACSDNVKHCFISSFSFINPDKLTNANHQDIPFKYLIKKSSPNLAIVITDDENSVSEYEYNNGVINLKKLSKLGGDELKYNRCSILQYYLG